MKPTDLDAVRKLAETEVYSVFDKAIPDMRVSLRAMADEIEALRRQVEYYANLAGAREREGRHKLNAAKEENEALRKMIGAVAAGKVGV